MKQKIGFIGLGNIGSRLAASLVGKGYQVTVYDLDESKGTPLVSKGAQWGGNLQKTALASDVLITCLAFPPQVASVVEDDQGILTGLRAGATWIDMTTNDFQQFRRLSELAESRGVEVLEAPVTGGVYGAAAGTVTIFVGGKRSLFDFHLPIFEALGRKIFYMGPLGSACTMKIASNLLTFTNLVALGEALMFAKRGGLDLSTVYEALKHSSANSEVHVTEGQLILNGSYNVGFTLDLACKDLSIAHRLGQEFGVPLEIGALVEQTFIRARAQYGGQAWATQVVKLLEDAVGTALRAPGFPDTLTPEI